MRTWKLALTILLSFLILPPIHAVVMPVPGLSISVTNFQRFTSDGSYSFSPAIVQGKDGTVWVFWAYTYFNGHVTNPVINYRTTTTPSYTYNATAWSGYQTLVSTPLSQNIAPAASQYKNGTMVLSFASNRTGNFDIYIKAYHPGMGWSSDQQIEWSTLDEKASTVVAASDGSLWVFYDRTINPTSANIYYKTWRAGNWGPEAALTTDPTNIENLEPSAYQVSNGTIWLMWSRTDTTSGLSNIYYTTFKNSQWSPSIQLTSTTNADHHPRIIQDQNGTIWASWNRELPVTSLIFQNDIFYTYSVNNGASFIPEVNLTNDVGCSTVCPEDLMPYFAQLKDGRVYLFWSSNRDPQNYWNLYYATTNQLPFHNNAVTALTESPMKLRDYNAVGINVTVADLGTFPESFWLFIRATNTSATTIAAQFLSLAPGQTMTLQILWNTNGMRPAKYQMSAQIVVSQTEDEIVTGDNTLTGGTVWLVPPGDVNMDGCVTIADLSIVALAYHSIPGSPNWNPAADLNNDGSVGVDDLSIVAVWYHYCT